MITVGVDLATQPSKTAMASIEWRAGHGLLSDLVLRVTDAAILDAVDRVSCVGIDAPFGWPEAFIDFLATHRNDRQAAPSADPDESRRVLAFRHTDRVVLRSTGQQPLSVATNLLGLTAMRASGLLAALRDQGEPIDRAGSGRVIEVYPAASMRVWGLPVTPYKGANVSGLTRMVDSLLKAAPWLHLGPYEDLCRSSNDAFDSVIASLTARARALGHWNPPGAVEQFFARQEGWIVLPTCSLDALPTQRT